MFEHRGGEQHTSGYCMNFEISVGDIATESNRQVEASSGNADD